MDITGRLKSGLWVISQNIFRPYHSKTIHLSYGRILGDKQNVTVNLIKFIRLPSQQSHTDSNVHEAGAGFCTA